MSGWRPLLRLAWRDVRRAQARSALVLAMITLPVLAVTLAVVVTSTAEVGGTESLERRLGAADAKVVVEPYVSRVYQSADPDDGMGTQGGDAEYGLTVDDLATVLGREVRAIEWRRSQARVETDGGVTQAELVQVDLADPLAEGLATVAQGRLPAAPGEVMVNAALAEKGPGLGETLVLADGTDTIEATVVGVGEDATTRDYPVLFGPPDSVLAGAQPDAVETVTWLVDAGSGVTWSEVRALNERGASVLSRAVLNDPPSQSELPDELQDMASSVDDSVVAIFALIVAMALLEVVLLAGPAFAVTARRQSRTLALMAATGGTPAQARSAILATALVLGALGALLGAGLGIALAGLVAVPIAQHFSGTWFGPFDVPWLQVLAVAGFGLLAALLAALVPAWLASRMDVVAVLAGRRGDAPASVRSPILGLALIGVGVAGAVAGAKRLVDGAELLIAFSALVSVLGMILIIPVVVSLLGRVGRGLWLPLRYAVRDAARHRTRTVPAVAAVAATVAGVVALSISISSDNAESRETYTAQLPHGAGMVTASGADEAQWVELERIVRRSLPQAQLTPIAGVMQPANGYLDVTFQAPTGPDPMLAWYGGALGTSVVVADSVPEAVIGLDDAARDEADRALAAGEVVVFTAVEVTASEAKVKGSRWDQSANAEEQKFGPATVPASYVVVPDGGSPVQAVVPPAAAEKIGMPTATVALYLSGAEVSESAEEELSEALGAATEYGWFYVERGFQPDDYERLVLWVLGALGAVLMLGGTLTATFLALSDARPDLATLAAVGAAPRTRRWVAGCYALVIGGVGAVLGALVGFVPGIAVTYPLTSNYGSVVIEGSGSTYSSVELQPQVGPFLEIPWLMILAVVVALPLLTAALVAACARSRLPLVARID